MGLLRPREFRLPAFVQSGGILIQKPDIDSTRFYLISGTTSLDLMLELARRDVDRGDLLQSAPVILVEPSDHRAVEVDHAEDLSI